jgi:hypothetical protein
LTLEKTEALQHLAYCQVVVLKTFDVTLGLSGSSILLRLKHTSYCQLQVIPLAYT